jgi:CubicO group peptidase (beta-lactamase class C family)
MESVSKVWSATLILLLAQEGVLGVEDTVGQWLPWSASRRRPDHDPPSLDDSSGLIDDNDVYRSEAAPAGDLANVQDPSCGRASPLQPNVWPSTPHSRCHRRC